MYNEAQHTMIRLKLYYTADEITNNLYTSGSEYMTENNIEYSGLYHKYITGEVFTGPTWNSKLSKKLYVYKDVTSKNSIYQKLKPLNLSYDLPRSSNIEITKDQYNLGVIDRYFIKKYNSLDILEIDKSQYSKLVEKKIDPTMYFAIVIPWQISGPIEDTVINNVLVPGIRNKNILHIAYANSKMPGIDAILTNPLQYYSDTDFIVPRDINS